jgi:UV excision repair protein RAD23
MKLIHAGKVLKDDQTIEKCEIKPNDFLVVMVTKTKKPAAAPAAAGSSGTTTAQATSATTAPAETPKSSSTSEASNDTKTTAAETPATAPAAADAPGAPSRAAGSEFPEEVVNNLTSMGFPEDMVLACLRASSGNADVAVEFLTNGIPPGMESGLPSSVQSPTSNATDGTLSALRNHPQFNDLRRLVQSNPAMLQNVLTQIGQQQPELLAEINANQETFLQMMNEPINEEAPFPVAQPSLGGPGGSASGGGSLEGISSGMMDGMANPAQMAQLIQNMSPNELNQMAAMMGLSPDQLRTTAQMLQQIPPEQLQQYM